MESASRCWAERAAAIAVWPGGIRRWDSPRDADPLTDDDRRRIARDMADAAASAGRRVEVTDRRDPG